jgi:hypothetical protein
LVQQGALHVGAKRSLQEASRLVAYLVLLD